MVGMGLKKYAQELGFTIKEGVAYGVYGKYMLTMQEGAGYKAATFAVTFPDDSAKATIQATLLDASFQKQYRITKCDITDSMIAIVFLDNPGTMGILKNALAAIGELLEQNGVWGVECCNACRTGYENNEGEDVLIAGNVFVMHPECIDTVNAQMSENAETVKRSGNTGLGILGAALGAVVGAIPWAIAFYAGWFVGWLGLLIGVASKKGYELLGGKETKVKAVSVIVSSLISVVAVNMIVYILSWHADLNAMFGATLQESVNFFFDSMLNKNFIAYDPALLPYVLKDIVLGWVFAGLGIFALAKGMFIEAKSNTATPVRLGKR